MYIILLFQYVVFIQLYFLLAAWKGMIRSEKYANFDNIEVFYPVTQQWEYSFSQLRPIKGKRHFSCVKTSPVPKLAVGKVPIGYSPPPPGKRIG